MTDAEKTPEIPIGPVAEGTGANPAAELERLRTALLEKEHLYKRALADYDNYRRRTERDFAILARSGRKALLLDLLEVLDSFDRALTPEHQAAPTEVLWEGLEVIRGQLVRLLEKHGAVPFDSVGLPVDPLHHEVTGVVPADGQAPDTVVSELRKGYCWENEVLRPAQVLVAQGGSEPQSG